MSSGPAPVTMAPTESGRQANMPWVTPYLLVQDVAAALDFYESAFGFKRRPDSTHSVQGQVTHAAAEWQDGVVMMGLQGAYGGTTMSPTTSGHPCPISIYVYCGDVDALAERARHAGARVMFGPEDVFYGDRICNLVDPDGYNWCFATTKGETATSTSS